MPPLYFDWPREAGVAVLSLKKGKLHFGWWAREVKSWDAREVFRRWRDRGHAVIWTLDGVVMERSEHAPKEAEE